MSLHCEASLLLSFFHPYCSFKSCLEMKDVSWGKTEIQNVSAAMQCGDKHSCDKCERAAQESSTLQIMILIQTHAANSKWASLSTCQ